MRGFRLSVIEIFTVVQGHKAIMNTNSRVRTRPRIIDEPRSPQQAAAKYLLEQGHSCSNVETLSVDSRTTIHWRKRSGIGLCAIAYVISPGPGRGETVYLSTFNRMASGKGNAKFREKLIETLEISHRFETGATEVPINAIEKITATADQLMRSESFQQFLESGHKKADHHAAIDYLRRRSPT